MDTTETQILTDPAVENIEAAIDQALLNSIKNLHANELLVIKYKLIELLHKQPSAATTYWLAYTCENLAILYGQLSEPDKEENELKEGIKLLEDLSEKSAEHLALLSMMDGYAIKYCSPLRIAKHIEKCNAYSKKAIEIHNKNPRAFLSLGIFDFFSNEAYGGGNHTEEYLTAAIAYKNEKETNNPIHPQWGTNIAYEFLARYYLKNKKVELATKSCNEGLSLFPGDRNLTKIKKDLGNAI